MSDKQQKRYRRGKRIRAKIHGTANVPRLSVFRSSNHIYAQLIDDDKGRTLISVSDRELKPKKTQTKVQVAKEVGRMLATKVKERKIEKAVFDRRGYKYHGRVKAVAEGAREGGLHF